jgi:hypothetical protein
MALVSFSIYPDLARLWCEFAVRLKAYSPALDVILVDSSGRLRAPDLPGVVLLRLWNIEHGRKMDLVCRTFQHDYVWFCDDDVFPLAAEPLADRIAELGSEETWVVSLLPRSQRVVANGRSQPAVGSYCIVVKRRVVVAEGLSLRVRPVEDPQINWGRGYYDTADYAQVTAASRGWHARFAPATEWLAAFMGTTIMYLKMSRPGYSLAALEADLALRPEDWRRVSGHLGSAFCLLKTVELYEAAFGRPPRWKPPVAEAELIALAERFPNQLARKRAFEYFERYEQEYRKALAVLCPR